jgi:uncharacterized membrane protein YhhN
MPAWVVVVVAVLGLAHVGARYAGSRALAGVLKPLPILLLVLVVANAEPSLGAQHRGLVATGLAWSLVGDVCLVFRHGFVLGLASFLVAHCFYIAAFASTAHAADGLRLLPFALVGVAMLAYLWPHLGTLRLPVAVYMATLVAMGWLAAGRVGAPGVPTASAALAVAGAVVFMASDAILAVDRFAHRFAAADAAVMTTYYTAQTLIAASVFASA